MYKFTYVSSDSGDWSAWYLDGEKLVEGHKITALDLMDVIRHVFPHKLEIAYVQDEIVEMGLSESLGDICEIDSDLEEGAWKEFKDCIRMPDPLNNANKLYSKEDRTCKDCLNSKRVKMENGKFTYDFPYEGYYQKSYQTNNFIKFIVKFIVWKFKYFGVDASTRVRG